MHAMLPTPTRAIKPRLPAPLLKRGNAFLHVLPIGLLMILALIIGFGGLDFGTHWDEGNHIKNLIRSVETDNYLPQAVAYTPETTDGFYGYPSMAHDLSILTAFPELLSGKPDTPAVLKTNAFLLRLRAVFFFVSSLAFLWTYLTVLHITGDRLIALTGAALLLGSWEFIYHARWVATDALCAQWAALTLFLSVRALKTSNPKFLAWAAAAAGAAASTKYPAGLLIVIPYCGAGALQHKITKRFLSKLTGLSFFPFLCLTPGAILQPRHFIAWLRLDQKMYSLPFGPYTVPNAFIYAWDLVNYLGGIAWSHLPIIGFIVFLMAILGAGRLEKSYRLIVLLYPGLFFLFLCTQRVLIIRNVLHLLPVIAVLGSLGAWSIRRSVLRRTSLACLCGIALLGIGWNVIAMASIKAGTSRATHRMIEWVEDHPQYRYHWSPVIHTALAKTKPELLERSNGSGEELYVMYFKEDDWIRGKANQSGYFFKDFGPFDVNLDYYPTWMGRDHPIILKPGTIQQYMPIVFSIPTIRESGGGKTALGRSASSGAEFLQFDITTGGAWKNRYGNEGFAIAGDGARYPDGVHVTIRNTGGPPAVWAATTLETRALESVNGPDRLAAAWYAWTSFDIEVTSLDGIPHDVGLYCLDFDQNGRKERIDVTDAKGNIIDSRTISEFQRGAYLVWRVHGDVGFHVTALSGNAVVSGVFWGMNSAPMTQ